MLATAAVWSPRDLTDEKNTTGHNRTGGLLGVADSVVAKAGRLFSLLILVAVATAAVWSAGEMTDQEDTTRHDRTGSLLGVVDRGRDKLAVFHHCRSDDEVVD